MPVSHCFNLWHVTSVIKINNSGIRTLVAALAYIGHSMQNTECFKTATAYDMHQVT